jgi:hypothetical protein
MANAGENSSLQKPPPSPPPPPPPPDPPKPPPSPPEPPRLGESERRWRRRDEAEAAARVLKKDLRGLGFLVEEEEVEDEGKEGSEKLHWTVRLGVGDANALRDELRGGVDWMCVGAAKEGMAFGVWSWEEIRVGAETRVSERGFGDLFCLFLV